MQALTTMDAIVPFIYLGSLSGIAHDKAEKTTLEI
jgi:hypothetical protein